jgi:hypothetical protein
MSRAEGPRTVVMFPGQGSQTREMRVAVDEYCPGLAETACRLAGTDVFERVNESMSCAQPAIYCAGLAGWRRLSRDLDSKADRALVFAGHSLGEITALAAAGSLDTEEGLELVARRGELMDEASAGEARGGMLAVVGSDAHRVARESGIEAINLANDNSPFRSWFPGRPKRSPRPRNGLVGAGSGPWSCRCGWRATQRKWASSRRDFGPRSRASPLGLPMCRCGRVAPSLRCETPFTPSPRESRPPCDGASYSRS